MRRALVLFLLVAVVAALASVLLRPDEPRGPREPREKGPGQAKRPRRALTPIPAGEQISVVLVEPPDSTVFLSRALSLCPDVSSLSRIGPQEFTGEPRPSEIVVFNGWVPAELPEGRYLIFGAVPPVSGFAEAGRGGNVEELIGEPDHPFLRNVPFSLGQVTSMGTLHLSVPADAAVLLRNLSGDILAATLAREDLRLVAFGLDTSETTLVLRAAFPILVMTSVEFLAGRENKE